MGWLNQEQQARRQKSAQSTFCAGKENFITRQKTSSFGKKSIKNYDLQEIKLIDIRQLYLQQPLLNNLLCPFPKILTAKQGQLIKK